MSLPPSLRLKHKAEMNPSSEEFTPRSIEPERKKLPSSLRRKSQNFPFEGENDLEREIERNIAQQTSRMGEAILGAPGDIWSFAKSIFGFQPETNLPTSGSLRELSEKYSQGYTKPKSEFEEKAGEVQQDIASFMIPGSGKYNLARNIGIPILANLAKEGISYAGGDKSATAAKIGTMVALDLISHKGKGAKVFAGNLFNESENLIPQGTSFHSPNFEKSLTKLKKSLESGGSRPTTEKALKKIDELQSRIVNGNIEVRELIDFRKSINEMKDSLGGFDIQMPPKLKKKAIANLDQVKKEVIGALNEYGDKFNPEFSKLNKAANESYAAIEASDKMGKFIKSTLKDSVKNPAVKGLLGLGGLYGAATHLGTISKTAGFALPLYAGYEGYKIFHQVIKSPTLRRFYGNILKGAASGNASQVSKNAKALEKHLDVESD